jgi:hypothetical protein
VDDGGGGGGSADDDDVNRAWEITRCAC